MTLIVVLCTFAKPTLSLKCFALLVMIFFSLSAFSQAKKNQAYRLHIRHASSAILIDGIIDEKAWNDAEVAKDFFMVLPMDTSRALVQTEVRMTYDENYLYVSAVCYNTVQGPYMVESLRRDFAFLKNDNFIFFMDTLFKNIIPVNKWINIICPCLCIKKVL